MNKSASYRIWSLSIALSVFLLLLFVLNLMLGREQQSLSDVLAFLFGKPGENDAVLRMLRLPEALTAIVSGAGLAVSGMMMQALFRNPLAGPSVLGISSGASLGVALVYLLLGTGSMGAMSLVLRGAIGVSAAMMGAFAVLFLMMMLSFRTPPLSLLIVGLMVSYAVSALVGVLQFYATREGLQAYVIWGLGSFSRVTPSQLPILLLSVSGLLLVSLFLVKSLNLMMLGENYARNLGMNPVRARFILILVSGGLAAIITALCGPIAFIGLAVPHLLRQMLRTSDHRLLLPLVMLLGAVIALACNLIARLPGLPYALPVNAVTSLFGAPLVIWFMLKRKNIHF